MTKLVAIGDTHGRSDWKRLVSREAMSFDKMVFIGDYFDSREGIDSETQIKNFKDIVQLKRNYPEKIELMFGNHDFHYISTDSYSLYNRSLQAQIEPLLTDLLEEGILKLCYHYNGYLFSHAGMSTEWLERWGYDYEDIDQMVHDVNEMMKTENIYSELSFGANIPYDGFPSNTGDDTTQSPIWIRRGSLERAKVPNVKHVIGHTQVTDIQEISEVIMIDILGTAPKYISVVDDKDHTLDHEWYVQDI